ncbi:DUF2075 domain-containing protein [Bacillus sp. AGMB 02131]|uniref:DUF2075 domain-containing protein n=1 Tax=Peribacillus faecalis TaxID=2772559 RepID=A0A927CTC5_9BACI|nr:DNA/RNA helicase domain-containing protein [Peribacillus faecalis]MBD3107173.1 DUF2075 domain-containing protein [Peribacillus faecalis]
MKPINLVSLINAKNYLEPVIYEKYINHFAIEIKDSEIEDLNSLMIKLYEFLKVKHIDIFDGYYVGYTINQIGKEFDLLRFGENNIINIELKKEHTGEERIKKQLLRNKYYLSFLGQKVLNFTYVSQEDKLFFLDELDELKEVEITFLASELIDQILIEIDDIDKIFNPSMYLISPFNSTDRFIENEYFLTEYQEVIKNNILKLCAKKENCFITLEGAAGTGKTLLTYDIAKEFMNMSKRVLIFHCGILNNGHNKLIIDYKWELKAIKDYKTCNISDYDLIIVDETQRIRKRQLEKLIDNCKESNVKCIFSYDSQQTLSSQEIENNIPQFINDQVAPSAFALTEKIRTNKEISAFIKNLFDLSKRNPNQEYSNIHLQYFQTSKGAKLHLEDLKEKGWTVINYTPSRYDRYSYDSYQSGYNVSTHQVIGQEFDNVVAVLDKHFLYHQDGKLTVGGYATPPRYDQLKMFFQIITRTRQKLQIVIINNENLLKECLKILHPERK